MNKSIKTLVDKMTTTRFALIELEILERPLTAEETKKKEDLSARLWFLSQQLEVFKGQK